MRDDTRALRAAAFLTQALDLDLDPRALAADLAIVREEPAVTTYAAELEASIGTAAFLIYVYPITEQADDGVSGQQRFDADVATLKTAAERDAPGPRLLAHASNPDEGFLLATTPATFRILSGEAPGATSGESANAFPPSADLAEIRRAGARELLRLLRAANVQGGTWLSALQADGSLADPATETSATEDLLTFNEEETELALFLLDERSIQDLLRALNLFITAARTSTAHAIGNE